MFFAVRGTTSIGLFYDFFFHQQNAHNSTFVPLRHPACNGSIRYVYANICTTGVLDCACLHVFPENYLVCCGQTKQNAGIEPETFGTMATSRNLGAFTLMGDSPVLVGPTKQANGKPAFLAWKSLPLGTYQTVKNTILFITPPPQKKNSKTITSK